MVSSQLGAATGVAEAAVVPDSCFGVLNIKEKPNAGDLCKKPERGRRLALGCFDADTKIVPCWTLSSGRDAGVASQFLYGLRQRLANRVQLTTHGHRVYLEAVDYAFSGMNIDYAMLVKVYGESAESEKRYSPAQCIGCKRRPVVGDPDPEHIVRVLWNARISACAWATGTTRD
jgi:hypothetical protein